MTCIATSGKRPARIHKRSRSMEIPSTGGQ
jgi:hypothetical protein